MKRWRTKKELPGIKAGTVGHQANIDSNSTLHIIFMNGDFRATYSIQQLLDLPDWFEEFEEREWWVPKLGETYFCAALGDGRMCDIEEIKYFGANDQLWQIKRGNCFKTITEAAKAVELIAKSLREFHAMRNAVLSPQMFACEQCKKAPSNCQCRYGVDKEQPRD